MKQVKSLFQWLRYIVLCGTGAVWGSPVECQHVFALQELYALGVIQFIYMSFDNDIDNRKENYLLINLKTRLLVSKVKQEHNRSPEEIWNK